jgi:hypothetical protein
MPDWQKLVRQRLSDLALDAAGKDEVHAELAGHLEESYAAFREEGLPEKDAIHRTLAQVSDWQELRRKIQRARTKEKVMSNRVLQIWVPAFLTLLVSLGLLALIQIYGPSPWTVPRKSTWSIVAPVVVVYIPWLLSLPLIGAMGAYLSIRAGASQRLVLLAILVPVLPYLTFFLIGLPIALIRNEHVAHNMMFSAFFVGLAAWVILPGAALLAGGLPMQLYFSRRLSVRSIAGQ